MLGSDEAGCARELASFLAATTGADAGKLSDDLGAEPESIVEHALAHQEAVLLKANEDDAEGYYYMVLTFLKRLTGAALAKGVDAIVRCATSTTEQRSLLRLKACVVVACGSLCCTSTWGVRTRHFSPAPSLLFALPPLVFFAGSPMSSMRWKSVQSSFRCWLLPSPMPQRQSS